MPHIISSVAPGSLGMELGLRPGDKLLRLNGEAVLDVIDSPTPDCPATA